MPRKHTSTPVRYALGLMSGTSADGIDAACIRVQGRGLSMKVECIGYRHFPYGSKLRRRVLAAMAPAETRTQELACLHAELGKAFARAANKLVQELMFKCRPTVIGLAGQTVCHLPGRAGRTVTLQLGEASIVAAGTQVATVSDFRQSDVAVGGQGAPLVPWSDWVLFRDNRQSRAVQNFGGIGNVTWLPAGGRPEDVVAFDTGPGNMIIDELVRRASQGRSSMDRGGKWAARGRILESVLKKWLAHPYLRRRPPKSTGRETFGKTFVDEQMPLLRHTSSEPADWVATATAFSAQATAAAYRKHIPGFKAISRPQVIVCGGGARNPVLVGGLRSALSGAEIISINEYGINAQAKEAVSFAMMALACLDGVPANLPQVTGADRPAVLGRICPAPSRGKNPKSL